MTYREVYFQREFTEAQLLERLDTAYPTRVISNFQMEECIIHVPRYNYTVFDTQPRVFNSSWERFREYISAFLQKRPPKIFIQTFMNGRYYLDSPTCKIQNCHFKGPQPVALPSP